MSRRRGLGPNRGSTLSESHLRDLSDAAPAASDKHRLLHRMSRRRGLGPNRGSTLIESRLRDFREAETVPGVGSRVEEMAGRAYRTPRQRLRISTGSFIGCREGAAWVQTVARPLAKVTFATGSAKPKPCRVRPRPSRARNRAGCREPSRGDRRARLSDAAPAASDKHRLLHRMSRRRALGPNRGSTLIESHLRDFR